jgi:hypothetical protein
VSWERSGGPNVRATRWVLRLHSCKGPIPPAALSH